MKLIFQLFVKDIKKAKSWYAQKLGAKIIRNYPKYRCALISLGGTEIDMGQPIPNWGLNWRDAKKQVGKQIGVLLEVRDTKKEYGKLKNKDVKFLFKPKRMPWGETVADFKDIYGQYSRTKKKGQGRAASSKSTIKLLQIAGFLLVPHRNLGHMLHLK